MNCPEAVRPWRVVADRDIEKPERGGITLMEDEVSQARGHGLAVLEFGQLARAVSHGLAAIEQDIGDVIRLLLILLDVVAVGTAENLPVEMPDIIALGVFAMLSKLDGESAV